jgi:hypothetical protein
MRAIVPIAIAAVLLAGLLVVGATAVASGQPPEVKTVGQFARLPKPERRQFAISFMTTHSVDPCDGARGPLSRDRAQNVAGVIVKDVHPGPDAADGGYLRARATIGFGIRRILANIGC